MYFSRKDRLNLALGPSFCTLWDLSLLHTNEQLTVISMEHTSFYIHFIKQEAGRKRKTCFHARLIKLIILTDFHFTSTVFHP